MTRAAAPDAPESVSPPPQDATALVVVLDVSASDTDLARLARMQDAPTLARVQRYRQARDRQRSLVGYAALHHHLRVRMTQADDAPALAWSARGQPTVRSRADCWISLSHAGDHAAIAIADRPVGIDLEPWQAAAMLDPAGLAQLCFSPAEAAWAGSDARRCLQLWTAKEAVLKALGLGASGPWRDFSVPPPDETFQPVTAAGPGVSLPALRVAHCSAIPEVQLALCLQHQGPVRWQLQRQSVEGLLTAAEAQHKTAVVPLTCQKRPPFFQIPA